jgi:hypothetical protein
MLQPHFGLCSLNWVSWNGKALALLQNYSSLSEKHSSKEFYNYKMLILHFNCRQNWLEKPLESDDLNNNINQTLPNKDKRHTFSSMLLLTFLIF